LSIITPRTTDLLLNGGPNIKARKIITPKNGASDFADINKEIVSESETKPDPKPQKPLKIAMIGTAPSSRMLAPFNDPEWTIWGSSPGNMDLPRADAWFEIHSNLLFPECASYGAPYLEWLKKQTFPI